MSRRQLTTIVLAAAIVAVIAGVALIGVGVAQLNASGARPAANAQVSDQQAAQQLAAQRKAQAAQAAQQAQASKEASQQAAIADAKLASAQGAELKAIRSELGDAIAAIKAKARSSASAVAAWDRLRDQRQASYSSRYSSVSAHNSRERRRYQSSLVEVSRNGALVVRHTYHPSYYGYPSRPDDPAPLKVSVAAEKARLVALQGRIAALSSAIASQAPVAHSLPSAYRALDGAAKATIVAVDAANRTVRVVVVNKGAKGQVLDGSKIAAISLAPVDAALGQVDQSLASDVSALGLSAAQLAAP